MSTLFARASGLLLHFTSLPARLAGEQHASGLPGADGPWSEGDLGTGDLGPGAYDFVRFLNRSGQRWWQILPTTPTGYGYSPYQSPSSFAGNPLLISPALLVRDGLLRMEEWQSATHDTDRSKLGVAQLGESSSKRMELLRIAFRRYQNQRQDLHGRVDEFRQANADWLVDHCLYVACKNAHNDQAWNQWDTGLVHRDPQV